MEQARVIQVGRRRGRGTRLVLAALLAVGVAASMSACNGSSPAGSGRPPDAELPVGQIGVSPGVIVTAPTCASPGNLAPLGISVIVDRKKLVLPDGTAFALDTVPGGAVSGYQTCDGWLVRGFGNGIDTLSLWLVSPTGTLTQMVDKAEAPVAVAADGRRIAWRSGGKLNYGHVNPTTKAIVDKSSPAPERGAPIAVGTDSVVLGYSTTGGGIDNHDVWFPSLGDYKPTWEKSTDVLAVYTPALTDGTYLGLVKRPAPGTGMCLGVMIPKDSLKATKTACGIVTQNDRNGAVSPDGHWLGMLGAGKIAVVDLSTVFSSPAVTTFWVADAVGAWEDASNMLVVSTAFGGGLVRFHLGAVTADAVTRTGVTSSSQLALLPRIA